MSNYYEFDQDIFLDNVDFALETVEKMLEADRRPLLADKVPHKYENKFDLANQMTNVSIVAQMNVLERLGFTLQVIQALGDVKTKTTTLQFEANETCTFLKEQIVDVPDPNSVEVFEETTSMLGSTRFSSSSSTSYKVIRKVKEYHWTIKTHWDIIAFTGADVEKKIMIQSRDASTVIVTQSKDAPMEKVVKHTPVDLNLTWLLQQIDMEKKATTFTIDVATAKTPRRNEQAQASMDFFCSRMVEWLNKVQTHFRSDLQRILSDIHNPAVPLSSHPERLANKCSADGIFQPILPLLEMISDVGKPLVLEGGSDVDHPESISTLALPSGKSPSEVDGQKQECKLFSSKDTIRLLNAQVKSIDSQLQSFSGVLPAAHETSLFSIAEATLYFLLNYSEQLCLQYQYSMGYLESMLEKQLIAAIGKRVTSDDLEEFVRFHNAKFLTIPPRPFCHAIGRPNRFPYGLLSIESKKGGSDNTTPIETMMRPVIMSAPLEVPLNAATTLQLTGNTYLHGWMNHRSEQEGSNQSFHLSARARQFSSFLLVIGTMSGPNKLSPKDAIILQNKDEVLIPLLLEEIPSAKEFRDAIESLSPEQQRFAKSFRGMQLESSVFGVAVIQIKPQLEALLGLPEDSLAKEIKLTEDLMDLFVEYQVPSDLLSYDEIAGTGLNATEKVETVRRNVKVVLDVIEGQKVKQLEEKTMAADMAIQQQLTGVTLGSSGGGGGQPYVDRQDHARTRRRLGGPAPNANVGVAPFMAFPEGSAMIGGGGGRGIAPTTNANGMGSRSAMSTSEAAKPIPNVATKVQPSKFESSSQTEASPTPQAVDFTSIPKTLDATIEKFNTHSNLRSTKLKTKDTWSRKRQPDLLTKPETKSLPSLDVKSESNKAFDLLDAISRSGSLPIAYSDLHVVVCVTHCFEKDIMATVVEDNVNPIEKLEMSTLLLGSAIHGTTPLELIAEEPDRIRFQSSFPLMLGAEGQVDR